MIREYSKAAGGSAGLGEVVKSSRIDNIMFLLEFNNIFCKLLNKKNFLIYLDEVDVDGEIGLDAASGLLEAVSLLVRSVFEEIISSGRFQKRNKAPKIILSGQILLHKLNKIINFLLKNSHLTRLTRKPVVPTLKLQSIGVT